MINSVDISNDPSRKQASPYDENLLKTIHSNLYFSSADHKLYITKNFDKLR